MSHIPEAKLQIVKGLVEQAPDKAVATLLMALNADGDLDDGLTMVKAIVEAEANDRRVRNLILAPIAPLCGLRNEFSHIRFPPRALSQIWRGLKAAAPDRVSLAIALASDWRGEESGPEPFDTLCALAATGLRNRDNAPFAAAAEAADSQSGAETLAACLDLAPLTRRALTKLPEWLGRMTDEKSAALRLAYKDVVTLAEDGGPRFFEMLAGQLAEPWHILRVIAGAMARPSDSFLAATELAVFGERLLDDIDRRLDVVSRFNRDAGKAGAVAAVEAIHMITLEVAEIEQSLALTPEGVWGRQIIKQRRALAAAVEAHLRAVDDAVSHALPLQTIRLGPRTLKGVPRLTTDPDPKAIERASTLLMFLHEIRNSAIAGGFASARAKAMEILEARLDTYVEDVLDHLRDPDITDGMRARAYLNIAAELCGIARDAKAAQLVRRRAAAA
jgi:hypothetical protein